VKLLYAAAVLTLIALGLMVWSLFVPTPLPVMVAMSAGQALGTAAFGAYGYVVVRDILRLRRARRDIR
jgi:MFS family permease